MIVPLDACLHLCRIFPTVYRTAVQTHTGREKAKVEEAGEFTCERGKDLQELVSAVKLLFQRFN